MRYLQEHMIFTRSQPKLRWRQARCVCVCVGKSMFVEVGE